MIEELTALTTMLQSMVTDLSGVAIWVVIGFILYYVVLYLTTTAALYFGFKFFLNKFVEWRNNPAPIVRTIEEHTFTHGFNKFVITTRENQDRLFTILYRLGSKGTHMADGTGYMHESSLEWLEDAIRDKEEKDDNIEEEGIVT